MGYGLSSAIPTTLQIVAVFALGDASENKFHPVAVLPFMAFHGNTSGQVNACAAVHKTATIATSGLLLLKPLARLFVVAKSPNRGNFVSSHKDSHNHCFVSPCLRQFQKTLLVQPTERPYVSAGRHARLGKIETLQRPVT